MKCVVKRSAGKRLFQHLKVILFEDGFFRTTVGLGAQSSNFCLHMDNIVVSLFWLMNNIEIIDSVLSLDLGALGSI